MKTVMEYEEFKKELLRQVSERLGEDGEAEVIPVNKNNGILKETIGIHGNTGGLKPLVYVESLYEQYCMCGDFSACVGFVTGLYHSMTDLHMEQYFESWEVVKPRIVVRVANWKRNKDEWKDIPHKRYLDLAVYCRVILAENENGTASTAVKKSMLRYLGVGEEELWEAARSSFRKEKFWIRHIDEATGISGKILAKLLKLPPCKEETYILTNEYRCSGAVGMLRFDLLEKFAEQKEADLFILPSSVNEVLVIPDRGDRTPDFLRTLVKKNNEYYPDEGDLSENIYYYRRGQKKLEII